MAQLTSKELSAIEDQLNIEQNLIAKYKNYAGQVSDPQLKSKCEQVGARHQTHFDRLYSHLN